MLTLANVMGPVHDGPCSVCGPEGHVSDGDVQPTYVRLPKELHAAVKSRAQAEERTMAQLIRVALRYYLYKTEPVV